MYISWPHHYIPKISGFFSLLINPFFIYILQNDKKNKLGCYRHLLLFFAVYNLSCTTGDVLIPVGVYDHRYAFSIFIADGKSALGAVLLCFRCSFIPAAYAILHSHFVYRYLALFSNNFLYRWFMPYGLLLTVSYCSTLMTGWFIICQFIMFSDSERLAYLEKPLRDTYGADIYNMNILIAIYGEASQKEIEISWIAISVVSIISVYSVIVYIVLGVLMGFKLKSVQLSMSKQTRIMQRQLIKAVVVQAVIPLFVSFLPCLVAWYQPVFNINIGTWISLTASIAISFFPVLDPLALFYFIPTFRRRIREIIARVPLRRSGNCLPPSGSRKVPAVSVSG